MNEGKNKSQIGGFVVQAGILAAAGIIVRIIGILYRVPLTHIIGDEGNGYYTSAYNIYTIILLVASYSIPSAMSKVVSQYLAVGENKNAALIVRCAFLYVIVVGGAASLFTWFMAPFLVGENCVPVLRIFAPTIFFSGILGVFRGYFQSFRTMVPTSVSQILEQILNAFVSVFAAWLLISLTGSSDHTDVARRGAMGSALGTGSGVLIALVFMIFCTVKYKDRIEALRLEEKPDAGVMNVRDAFGIILTVITPFILSTFIYNFSTSLNQTIYAKMMKGLYHMDQSLIATNYGVFAGKAVVIANIPIALASAMSSAVIPNISAAFASGNTERTKRQTGQAVKVTMLIAIPCCFGLAALSEPVTRLLFPQKQSLQLASLLLVSIAVTVVFYSLSTLTNAILQGIGKVNTPVHNALAALVIQTIVLVVLLRFTSLGLYSLSIAMIVYSLSMCIMNQLSVRRALGYRQEWFNTFLIPVYASFLMGIVAYAADQLIYRYVGSNVLAIFVSLILAFQTYVVIILRRGAVTRDEILAMPKGNKILAVLTRLRLYKE